MIDARIRRPSSLAVLILVAAGAAVATDVGVGAGAIAPGGVAIGGVTPQPTATSIRTASDDSRRMRASITPARGA